MSIEGKIAEVRATLDRLHSYQRMINAGNFEQATVDDMRGNAKDLCDDVKSIINQIKAEVNQWS